MHWLDTIIIVALAITTFSGLRLGIIKAVLSLVGLIVGVILAGRFYIPFAGALSFIPQESLAKIAAFIIILVGTLVAASVFAWHTP